MNYIKYYNQYKDKIFSYFYYNLKQHREEAEDLTSETFLKAFEKFEYYDKNFAFSTWIFTIARNTLFDYYRKQKNDLKIDKETEDVYQKYFSYENDFIQEIENKEIIQNFTESLEQLDPLQKEIVILKYINNLSSKEIAQKIGKSESNTRKIASRWMKKARIFLWIKI